MFAMFRRFLPLTVFAALVAGAITLTARTADAGPPGKVCVPEKCKHGVLCFLVSSTPNCRYECTDIPCEPVEP